MADFTPHSTPITVEVPPHLQASLAMLLADGGHHLSPLPSERDTDLPAYEIRANEDARTGVSAKSPVSEDRA